MKKKLLLLFLMLAVSGMANAQAVGDTIRVQGFNYNSTTRDTVLAFPNNPALTFEKILLKYNMRCRNATVLMGPEDGVTGCGEWDYSCNTFIADSSKVEKVLQQWPDYHVSNFSGSAFAYTTQPTFDHYDFTQQQVNLNSIVSENTYQVGSGNQSMGGLLHTALRSGRSQILVTAAQLQAAGLTAGPIQGLGLTATTGGATAFLKLSVKSTSLIELPAQNLQLTGFTEVYFRNHAFAVGANRLQFHTPFNWDGTSNLILDFSFSNTSGTADIQLAGFTNAGLRSLSASNIGMIDTSAGAVDIDPTFLNTIGQQLTVSFWAYGDPALMPSNCSIVYGYSTDINQREINLHMPWDGRVYFDCGYDGGGFDRIEQVYGAESNIEGQWNHWVFVKNADTEEMKIFLNGNQWLGGSGKTRAVELLKLYLGKMSDNGTDRFYKGRIREFAVWDTEVDDETILAWKNKSLDATHPYDANLVAYYKLDQMNAGTVLDSKQGLVSQAPSVSASFERGDQLSTTFTESNLLPNLTFYRGTYNQTVTPVVERYSYPRTPRTVGHYSVTSNEGVTPMTDDTLNLLDTQYLYDAVAENIYNGQTGAVAGTLPVATEGTINVTQMDYFKRYPFYNELVSFVTPYGIGLDLGVNGKTWIFDMSDYVNLLKGNKRLTMAGGVWQEEMDLEFLFIVGTPPRNVVQYDQLWQGMFRKGDVTLANINNGTAFPTNNYAFSSDATSFKLKSSITGHGAAGEFSQNGGTIQHRIRANDVQQLSWTITQICNENPIFPQGGTWVYNRQGWCPGQRTLLKEYDITSFATPGSTVALDYRTSNAQQPGGDYRYITAHQVIGYGAPNFPTDAAIEVVKAPNNAIAEYGRINPMCEQPKLTLRNTGANAVTSVQFEYWLNNADTHQTFTWNGNLASMAAVDVQLPVQGLWSNGVQATGNKFHAQIVLVNGAPDGYAHNNLYHSNFTLPDVLPATFKIRVKTNNSPGQNYYNLYDDAGVLVENRTFPAANTIYTFTYNAPLVTPGCYRLRMEDTGNNGLEWWAATAQGTGYMQILDANDVVLKTFEPDFGGGFDYSFSINSLLGTDVFIADAGVRLYPNPSKGSFKLEGKQLSGSTITITDALGKTIRTAHADANLVEFTQQLNAGLYFVKVEKDGQTQTHKLLVQ
ncbi:T9SS type A sorting domain-containing protein [Flavobacterium caeni]|uniref:Por secretion system C-terminal sorting domain-containing protein n=1 Tax=Flavobacterium caeni TaxID=490189 RepID=A0A1G5AJN0_9FLAO|nr:T9SS type A sorting domain-containing protein [Flavobacterium caeni]SCX78106.1 Por secretion system C-terminal sorting domain-containing protein [Flavobacterium caeni]